MHSIARTKMSIKKPQKKGCYDQSLGTHEGTNSETKCKDLTKKLQLFL